MRKHTVASTGRGTASSTRAMRTHTQTMANAQAQRDTACCWDLSSKSNNLWRIRAASKAAGVI